ncbi:MAG: hypothetical protein RI897_3784 [Verrucomicrobiota bacterium]
MDVGLILGGEEWAELAGEFREGLGHYRVVSQDGHEVGITGPAGDDMQVQVFCDACSGALAEVEADVEALGFHDLAQCFLTGLGKAHEVEHFIVSQVGEVGALPIGDDEQVTAGVGVGIEERVAGATAGDDEVGFIFVGLADGGEEGVVLRGGFGGEDVLDSPGRVERFHRRV